VTRVRYDKLQNEYRLIRDCLEGEQAIKDAGRLYTPQPDGMTDKNYTAYVQRGCYYDAPAMTLRALVGLACRKEAVLSLPSRLEPMRLRATDDKTPFNILVEDAVREVLAMGRFGMLLDFPRSGNSVLTTPHLVTFLAENIDDYQTEYVDGQLELVRVVLASNERWQGAEIFLELVLEDTIYKVRRFVKQGQEQKRVDIGEEIIPTVGGKALSFIPFLMVSHQGIRPMDIRPPFSGLCRVSLSHYRNSCDREHAIFLTSAPTPWIAGSISVDKVPTQIGSGALWSLPEGATCGMLEFTGAGVAAMKDLMEEKTDAMAQLGARMLSVTMNRNEDISTATQRTRSELSLLHGAVVSVEAGLNKLLRIAAEWVGADPAEAKVTLSRDFIEVMLDGKQLEGILKLWQAGAISRQTLYENLQAGEIASSSRTFDEEIMLIEEEGGDISPPLMTFPKA
jgi:hypothetical protein